MFENSTWQASTKVMGSNTSIWPMSLENRFRTLPEPHRTNAENNVRTRLSEKCPTSNTQNKYHSYSHVYFSSLINFFFQFTEAHVVATPVPNLLARRPEGEVVDGVYRRYPPDGAVKVSLI
jgi:hypothetical protein